MALPANITYGTVKGTFIQAVGDGSDADRTPDAVPIANATITFTPSATLLRNATSSAIIIPAPVTVQTDATGSIVGEDGTAGIELLATDDANLDPVNWTWNVQAIVGNVPISFDIAVPGGTVIDLANVMPIPAQPGIVIEQGTPGPAGPATTITIGTVTTLNAGSQATASMGGTAPNQTLSLGIPQGAQGAQGDPGADSTVPGPAGPSNVLTIGTVTTVTPETPASATITGTSPNQVLSLDIPQGAKGADGADENLTVGTVTTLDAGSEATASITGTAPNQTLNLGIPRGADGTSGSSISPPSGITIPLIPPYASQTSSPQAGYLNLMPIYIPVDIDITAVMFEVTSAGSSPSTMTAALYSFTTNGGVGTLVHNFGTADTSTASVKTLSGNWSIAAGVYYLGYLVSSNSPTVRSGGYIGAFAQVLPVAGEAVGGRRYLSDGGASALPTTTSTPAANGSPGSQNSFTATSVVIA